MGLAQKWKAFWNPTIALAFDREVLWSVTDPADEPRRSAAFVALGKTDRKVVALGDEARDMRSDVRADVTIVNYVHRGTLADCDVAEAVFRHELRAQLKDKLQLTPRILVATSLDETAKRVVKDVVVHAGAREVIVMPRLMAAAIGSGLDVSKGDAETVVYMDRDWCGFAVVGRSQILAAWEGLDSFDQVVVEQAWRGRGEGDGAPRDFDAMFRRLVREGVENDPSCTALMHRMHEHYRIALATLSPTDVKSARSGKLHLLGPCATVPGLRALLGSSWERLVVVPPRSDAVVILGCRTVLGELDEVMKSFRAK